MSAVITVGLLDKGVEAALVGRIAGSRCFVDGPPAPDHHGHGTAIARIILHHAPRARLLVADLFGAHDRATPEAVAAGLDWLREERTRIVNLSFGLRDDRAVLRVAVEAALAAGLDLLAATPARGARVFPASYPGVMRVTGDARCATGEISALGGRPADFGACPRGMDGEAGGASFAVGHVSGLLAARLADGRVDPQAELARLARFHGPERRLA
jgi:subtilisin family serine protease